MNEGWEHYITHVSQDWSPLTKTLGTITVNKHSANARVRIVMLTLPNGSRIENFVQIKLDPEQDASLLWCAWPESLQKPEFPENRDYHMIRGFDGKPIAQPRKTVCYGHAYGYSGKVHPVEAETPAAISSLYEFISGVFGEEVNMCLGNAYLHGYHSISAHSDDEKQMGDSHSVYCFVRGATRRAIFRDKEKKQVVLDVELPEGFYAMMGESFQQCYTHEFPKVYETSFKKGFVPAIPEEALSALTTPLAKADWILQHQNEIREAVRGTKHYDAFEKWIAPRYSFTLRCFVERNSKRIKV